MPKSLSRILNMKIYLAVLVVAIGGYIYWAHFHHTNTIIPSTKPSSTSPTTAKSSPNTSTSTTTNQSTPLTGAPKSAPATNTNDAALEAPWGDFVSTNSVQRGEYIYSNCNTTAGATCTIQFAKDGNTQSLGTQTADRTGATAWYWAVNLDSGTWTITAVASLNGQTKSVTSTQQLEVQ